MFDWKKAAEEQWNNEAHSWSERSQSMWEEGSRKDIIPFIAKFLEENSKVLDVGCGNGYSTYKLYQHRYDATGVDLSPGMIKIAKEQYRNEQLTFLQGDIHRLPFSNETFDGVMAITVLEWTKNPLKAIQELKRVVKKDGFLCIGLLGPTAGPRRKGYPRLYGKRIIINSMMPWELQQLASEQKLNYMDGFGVYKKAVKDEHLGGLPLELKQALSFMWVYMFQKGK